MAEDRQLVPYAPSFTPASLGKVLGEDRVLRWLLEQAQSTPTRSKLIQIIANDCFRDTPKPKDRSDMARHVVLGLGEYGLTTITNGTVTLTDVATRILLAPPSETDRLFARHILAHCNGLRLIELIKSYELRGEAPRLEDLARELDRDPTAKSISTMKAWLTRAGVMKKGTRYSVDYAKLEDVLGRDTVGLFGLSILELEFVIAARLLERQSGNPSSVASDVADIVEARTPGIIIPRKPLVSFVRGLANRGVVAMDTSPGPGGKQTTLRLTARGSKLADDEIRGLVEQSQAGFPVGQLQPMGTLLENLALGTTHKLGHSGEMLAVHVCLMLGLKVESWRKRAPTAEIDLIADRMAAFGYQRWMIQVKNTTEDLKSDRVDREIGTAAGIPVTHILFVVPRAGISGAARREMISKSRHTGLHIYALTQDVFKPGKVSKLILDALREQLHVLVHAKRDETRRREGL